MKNVSFLSENFPWELVELAIIPVELAMSTRLCLLKWCIWFFMFWLWCIDWVGSLYANRIFLCISVLRLASGPRVKLASCKSALNSPVVYSTDRSKAVVPVLVLLFGSLWFILRVDLFYVLPCVILFLCFSVLLALRLPRLGKKVYLSAFCTFVRFSRVWFGLLPLPLGVWEGLRFVIMPLPVLFSYLFWQAHQLL